MSRSCFAVTLMALFAACSWGTALADVPSPDSSYVIVTFANAKPSSQPLPTCSRYVTILPNGMGETFASAGITITVTVKSTAGPMIGVPAAVIVLNNSALYICPGGNIADHATDTNGETTFTGTIKGGGCACGLSVFVSGVLISNCQGCAAVGINSPDTGAASPRYVDAGDFSAFAVRFGNPALYSICFDYNESGPPTIAADDLAYFAYALGAACQ